MAETRGGVALTPPANKMAADVTITFLYQPAEVATLIFTSCTYQIKGLSFELIYCLGNRWQVNYTCNYFIFFSLYLFFNVFIRGKTYKSTYYPRVHSSDSHKADIPLQLQSNTESELNNRYNWINKRIINLKSSVEDVWHALIKTSCGPD